MDRELTRRLVRAAGPPAPLDVERLRQRATVRRRRVGLVQTAAVAVVVLLGLSLVLSSVGSRQASPVARPDLVVPTDPAPTLVPFRGGEHDPSALPAGFAPCGGPVTAQDVVVTDFCDPAGVVIRILRGAHPTLGETGTPVAVGSRTAWTTTQDGWRLLTLSDSDTMSDTHYRIEAPSAYDVGSLVDVLRSIPAVARATR